MQLISHQNHINALPKSQLKTHIQKRQNQITEESEDIPPIFLLVEPGDDITGPDYAIVSEKIGDSQVLALLARTAELKDLSQCHSY